MTKKSDQALGLLQISRYGNENEKEKKYRRDNFKDSFSSNEKGEKIAKKNKISGGLITDSFRANEKKRKKFAKQNKTKMHDMT